MKGSEKDGEAQRQKENGHKGYRQNNQTDRNPSPDNRNNKPDNNGYQLPERGLAPFGRPCLPHLHSMIVLNITALVLSCVAIPLCIHVIIKMTKIIKEDKAHGETEDKNDL